MASPTISTRLEVKAYTGSDVRFELRRVSDQDPQGRHTGRVHSLIVHSDLGTVELFLTPIALERLVETVTRTSLGRS